MKWILDAYAKGNSVHLWIKGDRIRLEKVKYPRFFYLHLIDPLLHRELIEDLETRYRVEECSFKTVYGLLEGYRVYAGRRVAELIERQTKLAVKLYNVDVRLEQRFFAENGLFTCGRVDESRFSPDFEFPCRIFDVDVSSKPNPMEKLTIRFVVDGDKKERKLASLNEKEQLLGFFSLIDDVNPDVILMGIADALMERILEKAEKYNLDNSISRTGYFKRFASKSYHSYGRARYREKALLPEGRILIDKNSFNFREGGLKGIILASRLTGLSPNLTARFTPGTLISSYEIYEALKRRIAVPFRKGDAERQKSFKELKKVDRGGMILQPEPGFYENVYQLDFTSMYPSIIVKYNLSPETVSRDHSCDHYCDYSCDYSCNHSGEGFLSSAIKPLLELRIKTKKLKKVNAEYEGMDSMLKWLLVTCFGYTGYRNAKFGRIEVHEEINRHAREILLKTKEMAEDMGFEIIHGIVDCLWLRNGRNGKSIYELKQAVERETGLLTEVDFYDWIVFLPMADGFGAYNRYFGRVSCADGREDRSAENNKDNQNKSDGKVKARGIAARRRDTPAYIKRMQLEMLDTLSKAKNREKVMGMKDEIERIYLKYKENLRYADLEEFVIRKVIGKTNYSRRCPEASLLNYCKRKGIAIQAGLEVGYLVLDSKKWIVIPEWESLDTPDFKYYERLLEKAWSEIFQVFCTIHSL